MSKTALHVIKKCKHSKFKTIFFFIPGLLLPTLRLIKSDILLLKCVEITFTIQFSMGFDVGIGGQHQKLYFALHTHKHHEYIIISFIHKIEKKVLKVKAYIVESTIWSKSQEKKPKAPGFDDNKDNLRCDAKHSMGHNKADNMINTTHRAFPDGREREREHPPPLWQRWKHQRFRVTKYVRTT
jgi:hypothetical protein